MKKLIAAALAVTMVFSITACGSKSAETESAKAASGATEGTDVTVSEQSGAAGGTLVMATNAEFAPYEYHEGDKIVGIDAEIAESIAADLGMELEIQDMAFDSILASVQTGKADIGVAGMTVTEERLKNVNFTDSYATAAQVIIINETSDIQSPDDLAGKIIGVQLGTTGDIYSEDAGAERIERYNKGFEAVQALIQGKIDAVIIDREPAKVFAQQNDGLKILDEEFTVEEYAIALSKDNEELLEKINASLAKLKESGKLQEIIDKYIKAE